jgi:hypothetical protein
MKSGTIGIIYGKGGLPAALAAEAKKKGLRVVGIALQPPADESLRPIADEFQKVSVARLGRLISILKKFSVRDVVFAGKVPKSLLYENKKDLIPDMKAMKLLFSLKDRADDTIMKAVVREIEKNGIKVRKTTEFTEDMLAPEGNLTKKKPSREALKDIEFGWDVAKKIGGMDIGQTVVVKNRAVMAVEAIEGTDETIRRGGRLAGRDAVVVKVSKPRQDMRFDVPVVGLDTLASMKEVGAGTLAVEAGKCIIVDRDRFLREADRAGIAVTGIKK